MRSHGLEDAALAGAGRPGGCRSDRYAVDCATQVLKSPVEARTRRHLMPPLDGEGRPGKGRALHRYSVGDVMLVAPRCGERVVDVSVGRCQSAVKDHPRVGIQRPADAAQQRPKRRPAGRVGGGSGLRSAMVRSQSPRWATLGPAPEQSHWFRLPLTSGGRAARSLSRRLASAPQSPRDCREALAACEAGQVRPGPHAS